MKELNMLSANQINAQVKLVEMWKWTNDPSYPIQCEKLEVSEGAWTTRAISRGDLRVQGSSLKSQSSFINDTNRAWNKAPQAIKNCKSLYSAKIEIRKFVVLLPVVVFDFVAIKADLNCHKGWSNLHVQFDIHPLIWSQLTCSQYAYYYYLLQWGLKLWIWKTACHSNGLITWKKC